MSPVGWSAQRLTWGAGDGELPVVSVFWYMVKYASYFCTQGFKIFPVCVQSFLKSCPLQKQVLGWKGGAGGCQRLLSLPQLEEQRLWQCPGWL